MVPPGPHIISYASSSGRGDLGPTTSFFLHLTGGQVVVRRWDAEDEVLMPLEDEEEVGRGLPRLLPCSPHGGQSFTRPLGPPAPVVPCRRSGMWLA